MNLEDDFEDSDWRRLGHAGENDDLYASEEVHKSADVVELVDQESEMIEIGDEDVDENAGFAARERRMKSRLGIEGELYVTSADARHPANRNRPGFDDPYDLEDGGIQAIGSQARETLIEAIAEGDDELFEDQLSARLRQITSGHPIDELNDVRFKGEVAGGYRPSVPIAPFAEAKQTFLTKVGKKRSELRQRELLGQKIAQDIARLTTELTSVTEELRVAKETLSQLERA